MVSMKLLHGRYPEEDIRAFFPKPSECRKIDNLPKRLPKVLDDLSKVADGDVEYNKSVRVSFSKNELLCSALKSKNEEIIAQRREVRFPLDDGPEEEFTIFVPPDYMSRGLRDVRGPLYISQDFRMMVVSDKFKMCSTLQ